MAGRNLTWFGVTCSPELSDVATLNLHQVSRLPRGGAREVSLKSPQAMSSPTSSKPVKIFSTFGLVIAERRFFVWVNYCARRMSSERVQLFRTGPKKELSSIRYAVGINGL